MSIEEMTLTEVRERLASLEIEVRDSNDVEFVKNATIEKENLLEREKELSDIEERTALANQIQNGDIKPNIIEERKETTIMEEKKTFGIDSKEYRDAFYAVLGDYATAEQRAITVDNTAPGNGDALVIPKSLDEKIWDNIHTAHPILADIATVRSGMVMEVTKHTAIAARTQKKLDKDATPAEESNTFVKVTLAGYDYEKYVELTYAEAKMSAGALEDYLAEEISAELGESLAKDVFAQIEADASANAVTATSDLFTDVKTALGKAKLGGAKVIYAPSTSYYEIVGAVKSGSPFNIGATLGVEVKLDDAASHVTVLAPKSFILNVVQDTIIESQKDVKAHKIVVSGYMRAEGTLRQSNAAAFIQ